MKRFLPLVLFLLFATNAVAGPRHGITATIAAPAGLAQVNLGIMYSNADFPFLDVMHMADQPFIATSATVDPNLLLGANGLPTAMPNAGQWYTVTAMYFTPGDPWVLTYSSVGASRIVLNPFAPSGIAFTCVPVDCNPSGNRLEVTFTAGTSGAVAGTPISTQVIVTSITTSITNIRLFRKSQETLLNSGEIANPNFITTYNPYGRVRFMDWQYINNNITTRWVDRTTTANLSWSGHNINAANYAGTATLSGNDYTAPNAVSGNPSSWVNGQNIQAVLPNGGTISFKTVTGFSNSATARVTAVAHGFATNDVVFFTQGSFDGQTLFGDNKSINANTFGKFYTITKFDNDHFDLNGVNSSSWDAYVSGGVVAKQITLAAGLLPAKRILTADMGGLHSGDIPAIQSNLGYSFAAANLVYNSTVDALLINVSAAGWNDSAQGSPFETMVALANQLNVSPWFCFPLLADDDYITQASTYVRRNLNSNLIANWELDNEVWNPQFSQTLQSIKLGNVNWGLFGEQSYSNYYGWRFYNVAGLIDAAYAGVLGRRENKFGVWTENYKATPTTRAYRFEAPSTGVAAFPISRADAIVIAPYFTSSMSTTSSAQYVWQQTQGGSLAAAAMTWLNNFLRDDGTINAGYTVKNLNEHVFPTWITIANTPASGVPAKKLEQYEGGWGYTPQDYPLTANSWLGNPLTNTDRDNFYLAYYPTALFAQVWTDNAANFIAAGGLFPSQYTLIGKNWGTAAMWGVLQPGLYGTAGSAATLSAIRTFNGR